MNVHARRIAMGIVATQMLFGSLLAAAAAGWEAHVSPRLLTMWRSAQTSRRAAAQSTTEVTASPPSFVTGRFDAMGRLQVDVAFDCAASPPTMELQKLGMVSGTTLTVPPMCVVEGWAAMGSLPALASVDGVKTIDLPRYARSQGAVINRHPIN